MRRVDFQVDRLSIDALIVASYSRRLVLDFPLDIREVRKSSIRDMMELGPFSLCSNGSRCMGSRSVIFGGDIDELED